MGDLQAWAKPNGEGAGPLNPHPRAIGPDRWRRAEDRTCEIISKIQPTIVSEQRRKAVVDYVHRLIHGYLGSVVFPFGSVPLKTYLPDGDIDLTAFSNFQNDTLANDVRSVLEGEEQNKVAEFEVKDVQYIHAEVKLVKCLVQNIVVDISFNQLGGLCTLCFLEQVDRMIGKDHLFKRSIILIKAWCYYESRILGAHHGLISTYALETLVLYIFHLFHSTFNGPLEVLYRFLDYFSKFDWDSYCISLNGPVSISSFPELTVETPENDGGELLLSKEFLKDCVDSYSVPSKVSEGTPRSFPLKHLNIIDPLKENNNLGRSVSKGNFYRIRSAFTYGARKLGRILLLSEETIPDELHKFFTNTLDRHGSGQRPDVQELIFSPEGLPLTPDIEQYNEDDRYSGVSLYHSSLNLEAGYYSLQFDSSLSVESSGVEQRAESLGGLCGKLGKTKISEPEKARILENGDDNLGHARPKKIERCYSSTALEIERVSGSRLAGDATDLASPRRKTNETGTPSPLERTHHAPHLYFTRSLSENGKLSCGDPDRPWSNSSHVTDIKAPVSQRSFEEAPQSSSEEGGPVKSKPKSWLQALGSIHAFSPSSSGAYQVENTASSTLNHSLVAPSDTVKYSDPRAISGACYTERVVSGSSDSLDSLCDLAGDLDAHTKSLLYGRCCHDSAMYGPVLPFPPTGSYGRGKNTWDSFHRPTHGKRGVIPYMNTNGVVAGSMFSPAASSYYPVNSAVLPSAFGSEETKSRGIGTYFPNVNLRMYKEKHPPGRGRNQGMGGASHGRSRNSSVRGPIHDGGPNGPTNLAWAPQGGAHGHEASVPGRSMEGGGPPLRSIGRGYLNANVPASSALERLEFGTFGTSQVVGGEQATRTQDSSTGFIPGSGPMLPIPGMQRPGMTANKERVTPQPYHMKDEDFPPLSV
ncbi:uncharacterized protein LOC18433557 [Amborella trichopoda]|nr:uncharacterized protein LOC18433557 [Amborella trichopoda]|eukprot:XP_006843704.2 uncharacterized protein LOC18433557 [Amborella trichopoda]